MRFPLSPVTRIVRLFVFNSSLRNFPISVSQPSLPLFHFLLFCSSPMSSSSSLPKPSISRDDSICGWKCLRKLGSGGFGSVWKVQNADGILAALKTEFIRKNETETLRIEASTLRRLQWSEHFCQLIDSFKTDYRDDKLNVLVMGLTGRSLSRMRRMMPRRYFSGSTAIRVSRQCLQAIRDLHSIGYLHRDVKGSNFAWSPESRKVIMLDLGFCRRYLDMDENGSISHRPPRGKAFFTGTSFYCSIYVHKKSEQGRRDDLIAWLYMTVEFFKGKLPWRSLSSDKDIEKAKLKTDSSLFDGMPREVYFINDHIRKLKRQDKPDYGRIFNYIDHVCFLSILSMTKEFIFEKLFMLHSGFLKRRHTLLKFTVL
ncbi:hypothetical protein WR25_10568 [Diploscapter pachys]|uniref:Protein kinase domain-containing protein n=1 Tax=Diploscapter pachys TaxID=2018661 RepID=A0A2A2JTR0_9BILA|nr:hypothetical protein WR25_10568 [Diploscapter pachys]